ncbi:UPF0182 family protein [Nocardioides insulae]|uniref:UPF0182 family membrane protein n=1 Tax=Nocardioides insulae TaxID=394734 RepID=UPI00040F5767|nr:UPF0182 family protein [Nocardioides insulae]
MSELFDDDPREAPPRSGGRGRALIITGAVLVLLFFGLTTFATIYTDVLWFHDLGYEGVHTSMLLTRIGLFLCFGLLMAAVVAACTILAYRARPDLRPLSSEQSGLDRYREAVTPIRVWLLVGVSAIAGLFAGSAGSARWRTYMLWRNGGDFGQNDDHFGRDIGFYVFDLPWYHFLIDFTMTAAIVGVLVSLVVHYLYGGIRLQAPAGERFTGTAQIQVSVMLGIFVLAKAVDYWLDRYDLVHGNGPLMTGIGYTDDHAVLPAKAVLAGIAVICAALFFVNIWRRTWLLPSVGVSLLVLSAILLGLVWPAIVQGVQVRPSEQDKEASYLGINIDATRDAFAIDDEHVRMEDYTAGATVENATAIGLDAQVSSQPVVDPMLVKQLFEETQQGRAYYTVPEVLDVDHYEIAGNQRAVALGVRELDTEGISEGDRNWTNLHTVYTHGNGVIAAYANHRDIRNQTESRDIQWAEGRQPTEDDLVTEGPGEFEDRVYFGERSADYVVAGRADGEPAVELDLPARETGTEAEGEDGSQDNTTTYDGLGGVPIGSTFRQFMYAIKYGQANFLLSERVGENSEILYDRTPTERVQKVAPWLTLDEDPYPVVADGRLTWVLDGYTTTDKYPSSDLESYQTMTDDSLQQEGTGLRTIPTDEINYMRNAVKATVDAYDGTVTLYEWDEDDPILQAWSEAFPGVVKAKSQIPEHLLEHLRYPEDMFKAQRYQLARYHVTDPVDFLRGNDRWAVPRDPDNQNTYMAPYRTFVDETATDEAPEDAASQEVWSISSTFVPFERSNLAAVMTANSDATSEDYGTIRVLERNDNITQGPGQAFNLMTTNSDIAEAVGDFSRSGADPLFGQLITVPTAKDGLMYIAPVYAVRSLNDASYPTLAYVMVSYAGRVGFGETLGEAIGRALAAPSEDPSVSPDTSGTTPSTSPSTSPSPSQSNGGTPAPAPSGSVTEQVTTLLNEAQDLFEQAQQAGANGNYSKRENLLKQAQAKVDQATELLR